jgi:hypothetical protein
MTTNLKPLLERYRRAWTALEQYKSTHFYHGTPVTVSHPRYTGLGVAVTDGTCWPDHVAVRLPNGNTWRYPMEYVKPNNKETT